MSRSFLIALIAALVAGALGGAGAGYLVVTKMAAPGGSSSPEAVRSALLARPEIVEEAFYALQAKRQAEAEASKAKVLGSSGKALYDDKRNPVIGPDGAPFELVEFFDYNCAYCKLASKWIKKAMDEHPGKIRLILKDFPILEGRAKGSREASAAAWAARLQGADKYKAFHFALLDARGGFDSVRIDEIAAKSGVNVEKMRADMKAEAKAFAAMLDANYALAKSLDINGTPGFVTGSTLIAGADTDQLQALLDAALQESDKTPS